MTRITDVTDRVKGVVPEGTDPAEANQLKRAEMTRIENECSAGGGDRCDVETFFSGGRYNLYQYDRYTDIRLVFAPEARIAAFGGDPDNFNYPRYCLDFTLLRVYTDGKPAKTENYLKWSREGVKDGELTFISGHPGTTGRLLTMAALEFGRDYTYPLRLERYERYSNVLEKFAAASADNARIVRDDLLGFQNSRKAYAGFLSGLRDQELMARKRAEEKDLRAAVLANPDLREKYGDLWSEVEAAYKEYKKFYKEYYLFEAAGTGGSELLAKARLVLRYATETAKPDADRMREFVDSALPTREQEMFSPAPIHKELQQVELATHFHLLVDELGAGHPVVKEILAGRTPEEAAAAYVDSSRLDEVAVRKQLAADLEAVKNSDDGMIRLARIIDAPAREARKRYEDKVEAVLDVAQEKVAQARYAVYDGDEYPDATFTLRMSYGPVKGYVNEAGQPVPYTTRIGGVYERATGKDPYQLPPSWIENKDALDMDTPFDFVTTVDSHGGNSGSPTINTKGEVIGILFDGNIESLPNRFVYTDERARSVHVASQVIVEALRKVYKADRILKEIGLE